MAFIVLCIKMNNYDSDFHEKLDHRPVFSIFFNKVTPANSQSQLYFASVGHIPEVRNYRF
jgi:hypothetical protein